MWAIQDYCMHKRACMYVCRHPDIGSLLPCSVTLMMCDEKDREGEGQPEMMSVSVSVSGNFVLMGIDEGEEDLHNYICVVVAASASSMIQFLSSLYFDATWVPHV